jgi:hypothetical protein
LNIYDTKQVHCYKCDRFIGEIEYDAEIIMPLCGKCANPMPEGDDKIRYTVSKFSKSKIEMVPA